MQSNYLVPHNASSYELKILLYSSFINGHNTLVDIDRIHWDFLAQQQACFPAYSNP